MVAVVIVLGGAVAVGAAGMVVVVALVLIVALVVVAARAYSFVGVVVVMLAVMFLKTGFSGNRVIV